MNEHQFDVNVSFRLNNILEFNGRPLETPKYTPDELGEVVNLIDKDLKRHFTTLEKFDDEYRPTSSRFLRPVILIARLALIDQPYNALTKNALISGQQHITHPSLLTKEALLYWNSIEATEFQPQVHILAGIDNESSGIWLGITERQ